MVHKELAQRLKKFYVFTIYSSPHSNEYLKKKHSGYLVFPKCYSAKNKVHFLVVWARHFMSYNFSVIFPIHLFLLLLSALSSIVWIKRKFTNIPLSDISPRASTDICVVSWKNQLYDLYSFYYAVMHTIFSYYNDVHL